MSVLVLGSLNCDLVMQVEALPRPGETVHAQGFATFVGGKGANQAIAAARALSCQRAHSLSEPERLASGPSHLKALGSCARELGRAGVAMIGRVGADALAAPLLAALDAAGVDRSRVLTTEGSTTGVATITVDAAGQNSIVVAAQANGLVTPDDVAASASLFEGRRVLVAQLEVPIPAVTAAFAEAKRRGLTTILNPAPISPERLRSLQALLANVDVLVPNETELSQLAGLPTGDEAQIVTAGRALAARSPHLSLVITAGGRGAFLIDARGAVEHVPAFAVEVVDTTAAGDAFCGALAVALAEGAPLAAAVRFGCAAGALACSRRGAEPSLPSRAEIDATLAQ